MGIQTINNQHFFFKIKYKKKIKKKSKGNLLFVPPNQLDVSFQIDSMRSSIGTIHRNNETEEEALIKDDGVIMYKHWVTCACFLEVKECCEEFSHFLLNFGGLSSPSFYICACKNIFNYKLVCPSFSRILLTEKMIRS